MNPDSNPLEGLKLIRLESDHPIKPFDCGDPDLNDFFINDSKNYQKELLTVTYVIESGTETVAFFSLLNDKISYEEKFSKADWRRFQKIMPHPKRHRSFPAMKVGRLGVTETYKGKKIGTVILDYLKQLFIENNRTGCRFITVDAYRQSLKFYENNEFKYLSIEDEQQDTRLMYFDLSKLVQTI